MSGDVEVLIELERRLKIYWDSTLKNKLDASAMKVTSIDMDKITFTLLTIDYEDMKNPAISPKSLVTKEFENKSNAVLHSSFSVSEQVADSFKNSFTEGLKLGAGMKFSAGVPLIGKAAVNVSVELSLSSTQESSTTRTNSWTDTETIDIPAREMIRASFVLDQVNVRTPFTATVLARGVVTYHIDQNIGVWPRGSKPGPSTLSADLDKGTDWPTYPPLNRLPILASPKDRMFSAKGIFTGLVGLKTRVVTETIKAVVN